MSDFEFTHNTRTPHSSAVDEIWYNEDTKELAVDLHDEVYVYSGVPKARYDAFVLANSKGRAFREIKRDYGPSEYLGDAAYLDIDRAPVPAADMSAVGTPKGLTYAAGATIVNNTNTVTASSGAGYLSLTPAPAKSTARRHKVVFDTPHGTKSHEVSAESVEDAAQQVTTFTTVLGVEATVKEVTVYFE